MEVRVGRGHIAQRGPHGADEKCTPEEEDGVEDHDDKQGPDSEDEERLGITDVTLLFTVARSQGLQRLVSGEIGCQCCTDNNSRTRPAPNGVEAKPAPVLACQTSIDILASW